MCFLPSFHKFCAVQVRKLTSLFQTKIKGVFLSFLQILQQASRVSIPTYVLVFRFLTKRHSCVFSFSEAGSAPLIPAHC